MMIEYKSIHTYSINLGRHIGLFRLNYDFNPNNEPITIPCKLKVKWNNVTIETGFIGSSDYDQELVALGYSPTSNNTIGGGYLTINKTLAEPGVAEVTLYTPIEESLARVTLECPGGNSNDSDSDTSTTPTPPEDSDSDITSTLMLSYERSSDAPISTDQNWGILRSVIPINIQGWGES